MTLAPTSLRALAGVRFALALQGSLMTLSCGGNIADELPVPPSTPPLNPPSVRTGAATQPPERRSRRLDSQELTSAPRVERPIAETCEENPLLAGCPPNIPESIGEDDHGFDFNPAGAAENVLMALCGQCHGSQIRNAVDAEAELNFIDDIEQLIAEGYAIGGDADNSRIVQVMRNGTMPPIDAFGPRPSDSDIETVVNYLNGPVFDTEDNQ